MGILEASAFIELRGYKSKAAGKYLLGAPVKFDVKGYGDYVERINKLEQLVLTDESGIHPLRLTSKFHGRPSSPLTAAEITS